MKTLFRVLIVLTVGCVILPFLMVIFSFFGLSLLLSIKGIVKLVFSMFIKGTVKEALELIKLGVMPLFMPFGFYYLYIIGEPLFEPFLINE